MIDRLIDLRGYGTVEKWVTTNPNISAGAKGFYSYLCSFAGNKDNAYPGTDLICHHMDIAKGTLQKYIKELKENDVIEVTQERNQGKFSHNIYTLLPFTETQKTMHDNTVNQKTVHQKIDSKNNSIKNNSNKNNSNEEVNKIIDKYNSIEGISKCMKLTSKRKSNINARLKDYGFNRVMDALSKINDSDFLKGCNDRKFKADIDWVFNPNNFVKILENKYSNRNPKNWKTKERMTTNLKDMF